MLIHQELGIYQVRLPLPFRLNHVNCYAIKGSEGWFLIDSGLSKEATQEGWLEFFRQNLISPQEVLGIYLTHFHPDHYGASGWLQALTGAPVYVGEVDAERISRYWKNGDYALRALGKMFCEHGMPENVKAKIIESVANIMSFTVPHSELTTLEHAQTVRLGDIDFEVIWTPGHTDGHVCYYNRAHKVLLSGDHLLPGITSNISLWPQPVADLNPLDSFLKSLGQLRNLNCELVLPAHGRPFTEVDARISELLAHHQERLQLMKERASSGANAYEVCLQVFKQELSMHELRFAMAETLAHLMHLVYLGELKLEQQNDTYRFILI